MAYVLLAVAILAEVAGTTSLKFSDGFVSRQEPGSRFFG
jgi:multidrug transporter EmrE-like cation transporter